MLDAKLGTSSSHSPKPSHQSECENGPISVNVKCRWYETPFAGIEKIWRKVREKYKMPTLRIHDLRHSFASVGVASGASLPVIGAILGHREVSTTQRYAHLADNPVRVATDAIAAQIENALGGGAICEGGPHSGEDHLRTMKPNEIRALVNSLQKLLDASEAPPPSQMLTGPFPSSGIMSQGGPTA